MSPKTEPKNTATNNGIDTHGMNFVKPNNEVLEQIFKVLLPNRLFNGPNEDTEIDLYNSGESPEELFGDTGKDQFYTFFTTLERLHGTSDKMMKREIARKGTWLGKSSAIPRKVKISQGKEIIAGTKRQLKFTYDENYKPCKDRDEFAWILHEYVANKEFIIKYMANESINMQNYNDFLNNIEVIAFCCVYKKKEVELKPTDKRKRDNQSLAKQRKKIRPSKDVRDDNRGETIIDDGSATIKNDTNVDNENGMKGNGENANNMVSEANNATENGDYDPFAFLTQTLLGISTMDAAANDYGDLINYDGKDYGFGWLHSVIGYGGVDMSLLGYY